MDKSHRNSDLATFQGVVVLTSTNNLSKHIQTNKNIQQENQ